MSYSLGTFKIAGVLYKLYPTEFTKNGYPKRKLVLEFPVSAGGNDKTSFSTFMVLGDDSAMLDVYHEGSWVEIMFKLDGFWWTKPETGEKILLDSHKIIDIHKGENPFEGGKSLSQDPDDNTPDHLTALTKNVKDFANSEPVADILPNKDWMKDTVGDANDPLPF